MRTALRLTDLLARLHAFTAPLPPTPVAERPPVVEPVETTHTSQRPPVVEPVETTPTTQRPPVVEPVETTHTSQRPPVVEPVETTPTSQRPPVVEPVETTPTTQRASGVVSTGSTTGLRSDASRASILDPLGRSRSDRPRVGHPVRVSLPFLSDGVAPTARALARQVDETTCGAAVLAMMAMAGDPWLALQVARDPAHRFATLQHRVHRACARTGPVPWPRRFGTAPWAAATVARFGDTRFTHRVVGGARGAEVLAAAVAAASSGVPVPLFTGGDLGGGWQAAVPRHVVLLADARPADARPAAVGPDDARPDDARPDDARPDDARPDDARPDDARPDDARPDDARPDDARPDDARPDDARPDDARPDDARPDDARPDDARPDDARPDDARPDDARPDDDVRPGGGSGVVGPGRGVVRIYEPSSATLHTVPTSTLLDPDAAAPRDRAALTAALGGWPHVVWALLPR
ncbi:hypothetical protein Xcel_1000 [Xylanimonas cellulosilytica DSM 15894]|uniref:Uncharacterized protein n=1 Tax=Xylanimonas cellulosilytica (strain DSM 15894 / JCM 12276 / CECT 5975 / KCTC 9989 / LMG 20990 / NBRC 107835 / XIL07) TaxID=446471 RepID=D1BYV6_XYLCX|nr:hypothetical protein [Xylanimonas cellulosilytica]ACZ30031.1 hypothetical protein Xcel_1000 [Xylanimonas cellulosilytica DSM 15894]